MEIDHDYAGQPQVKKKRITHYCCVPQCNVYFGPGISLHYFPKDEELKKKWEVALKMGKAPSQAMRVCSRHFTDKDYFPSGAKRHKLFPHAVPSQNLPKRLHDRLETSPIKRRKEQRLQRRLRRAENSRDQLPENDFSEEEDIHEAAESEVPLPNIMHCAVQAKLRSRELLANEDGRSLADLLCDLSGGKDKTTQVNLSPDTDDNECGRDTILPDFLTSSRRLYTFTGLHNLDLLDNLVACVEDLSIEETTNKKLLPIRTRIILTMVRIKLNMSFTAVAVLFGISRQTCSNYFRNMCPMLARVLKVVIPWPDHEVIRSNLPLSFDKYRYTRIIFDCAEIVIEKSHCLKCRILTWSQYKKNHTVQFNLGVSPSGLITEVSKSYGGRASDKFIVNDSGILDKLDYQDGVMVDKGYKIDGECLVRNIRLIRPPFLQKKQQLSRQEALECAEIARARVHIERVFQRMREYELISARAHIPWHLSGYIDEILLICAALTNLGPPIMNIDKFM